MKTIAIVEDDINIGNMLSEVLIKEGYNVLRAYSGTEALYLLSDKQIDLILLDLMLPGIGGEDVLKRIKTIPVIVISAKNDVDSKVNLLLSGAVDYITKPFNTKELLARIAVQFRESKTTDLRNCRISVGNIKLDTGSRTVYYKECIARLTKTETMILKTLLINHKQVVSKSLLLDKISDITPDCTEDSLKQHISNLRKKLKYITNTDCIESVWGIGFKLYENIFSES